MQHGACSNTRFVAVLAEGSLISGGSGSSPANWCSAERPRIMGRGGSKDLVPTWNGDPATPEGCDEGCTTCSGFTPWDSLGAVKGEGRSSADWEATVVGVMLRVPPCCAGEWDRKMRLPQTLAASSNMAVSDNHDQRCLRTLIGRASGRAAALTTGPIWSSGMRAMRTV